jgi:hypothetical protein
MAWYERRTAAATRRLGPLVALGHPYEKLPAAPYAARDHLIGDWQKRVTELIDQAALVIAHIGTTPALVWELEQLGQINDPEKVVLCLPRKPLLSVSRRRSVKGATEYREFRKQMAHVFPRGLPKDIGQSAFITFAADWRAIRSADLPRGDATDQRQAALQRLHRRLLRPRLVSFTAIP